LTQAGPAFVAARDAGTIDALASALGRPIGVAARAALADFAELVARWNARIDLTAARTPEQLCEVLFADALVLADHALIPDGARVLDVGSGAGAPSLPLALLRPDVSLVLVEPLHKRVAFLRTAVGTLPGLAGRVTVREARLEPSRPAVAGAPFDVALARATFAPASWLPLGLSLASRTLVLTAAEAAPTPPAGTACVHAIRYALPRTDAPRTISAYARIAPT
jgi:16S rRNA (guanine527-N7)-methyltransferase